MSRHVSDYNYLQHKAELPYPSNSVLGKRKIEEAFGRGTNDCARYGREIPPDFFKTNHGHSVFSSSKERYIPPANSPVKNVYTNKLNQWREKYKTHR
jgi:hypothetical protein